MQGDIFLICNLELSLAMNKKCGTCKTEKTFDMFYKASKGTHGISARCKQCDLEYQKQRKEQKSISNKKWADSNKGIAYKNLLRKKSKTNKLIKLNDKLEKLGELTEEKVFGWKKNYIKRNIAKAKATPHWLDFEHKQKILQIYAITQQLQESTGAIYHVDHIVPLMSESVCGLHVWWNLQPLQEKSNVLKNNTFNPAIYPEQGEVAFPLGGRLKSSQILLQQRMEQSDE